MKKSYFIPVVISVMMLACNPATKNAEPNNQPKPTVDPIEKGKKLVNTLGCNDCHSPKMMTAMGPVPDTLRLLSGHQADELLPEYDANILKSYVLFNMNNTATIGPWGTSFAANLTPDPSGIGNWTEDQFLRSMKQGKWKGLENSRQLLPPMPWQSYSQMDDEDLKAIFAYLKSIKPLNNLVPMAILPSGN